MSFNKNERVKLPLLSDKPSKIDQQKKSGRTRPVLLVKPLNPDLKSSEIVQSRRTPSSTASTDKMIVSTGESQKRKRQSLLRDPDFSGSPSKNSSSRGCVDCLGSKSKLRLNNAGDFVCNSCGYIQTDWKTASTSSSSQFPAQNFHSHKPPSLLASPPPLIRPTSTNPFGRPINNPVRSNERRNYLLNTSPNRQNYVANDVGKSSDDAKKLNSLLADHELLCDEIKNLCETKNNPDDKCFKFVCGCYCQLCEKFVKGGLANKEIHRKSEDHARKMKDLESDPEAMLDRYEKQYDEIIFVDDDISILSATEKVPGSNAVASSTQSHQAEEFEERYDRMKRTKK